MIEAILFDVGGTLIKPEPSVGGVYSSVAARHKLRIPADELDKRFRIAWKNRAAGFSIDEAWWKSIVTETFQPFQNPLSEKLFSDIYQEFRKPEVWHVFSDVVPIFNTLKEMKIKIAVASNWDNRLPELLSNLKLNSYLDHQFISCEIGVGKPDPKFFQICLDRLSLRPDQVIHIGDDPINDVKGPSSVGIKGLLIDRKKDSLPDILFQRMVSS